MTELPLVSIVLPTYNGSRYLAESIQSCLDQTYAHWELILVDDASHDETPEIIARFAAADSRIRSIRHATNRRLPGALNTGFAASRGRYLTWTSDDNRYEADALAVMVEFLERKHDVGLVYCDVKKIGARGEDLGMWRLGEPEDLPRGNTVEACFLYRREVYEAVGDYAEEMFLVEDYDYWLRVSRQFRIEHLRGVSPYEYRLHEQSLTERRYREVQVQLARAQMRNLVPAELQTAYFAEACWNALWLCRSRGDWAGAREFAWRSVWLQPWRPLYWRSALLTTLRASAARLVPASVKLGTT